MAIHVLQYDYSYFHVDFYHISRFYAAEVVIGLEYLHCLGTLLNISSLCITSMGLISIAFLGGIHLEYIWCVCMWVGARSEIALI